jgi:hypothetical protein
MQNTKKPVHDTGFDKNLIRLTLFVMQERLSV